jgi:hypothetical protein
VLAPLNGNDWMLVPGMAAATAVGKELPMPGPDQPGPMSFAEPSRVRTILTSAGYQEVDIHPHTDFVVTPEEAIPHHAEMATRVGRVRELLKDSDDSTRAQARAAIDGALRVRLHDGEVRLSRGVYLVTARA